jgi:hypothetical protein
LTEKYSLQILVGGLTADETLRLEGCLTDPLEGDVQVAKIANRGGALLSEIQDIAYTVIVSGFALDYLASVISRIRRMFAKCTVFDFRNNTLAISQHTGTGELAGKCIIVGPKGDVTISDDQSHIELIQALRQVTGAPEN